MTETNTPAPGACFGSHSLRPPPFVGNFRLRRVLSPLVATANPKQLTATANLCRLIWCALIEIFRPRAALQAEILVLRHQLIVLRRKSRSD